MYTLYINKYIYIYIYIYIYNLRMYVCMYVCIYIYICVCVSSGLGAKIRRALPGTKKAPKHKIKNVTSLLLWLLKVVRDSQSEAQASLAIHGFYILIFGLISSFDCGHISARRLCHSPRRNPFSAPNPHMIKEYLSTEIRGDTPPFTKVWGFGVWRS